MPIEMPRGLPFSVDTWSPNSKRKRHHFLTHAHKDHSTSISTYASYPIYSTHLTKSLVILHHPKLEESLFVCIEVGESIVIKDLEGEFKVTALDANHCPGAVMFLFEGNFGNILHTGDCRLTEDCVQSLPLRYVGKKGEKPLCQLDYIFLDCTFGKSSHKFPSKHSAIQQVINCIWAHPTAAMVYLTCDLLGQEDVLANVFQAFGSKIYVDKVLNAEWFQALLHTVPHILTEDPSSRFCVLDGFPKLYERAAALLYEAQANCQPEPLIIRPSTQWYVCEEGHLGTQKPRKIRLNEAMSDRFGVWHVCYSNHSSREELEWSLELLAPKWVVSTTPSCRAMELDYVKKHCLGTRLTVGDPLWKLLDISTENTSDGSSTTGLCSLAAEEPSLLSGDQLSTVKASSTQHICLSPQSKRPGLTLFGRARHYIEDCIIPSVEKIVPVRSEAPKVPGGVDQNIPCKRSTNMGNDTLENEPVDSNAEQQLRMALKEKAYTLSCSPIGSSESYSGTLRQFYRSMNVPVPHPLPSLLELMNGIKRRKR